MSSRIFENADVRSLLRRINRINDITDGSLRIVQMYRNDTGMFIEVVGTERAISQL